MKRKKYLSLFLTIVMVLTAIGFNSPKTKAAAEDEATVVCSWNIGTDDSKDPVVASLYSNGVFLVTTTGAGQAKTYAFEDLPWKDSLADIKTVYLSPQVQYGNIDSWFRGSGLEEMPDIPVSITSIQDTFEDCNSLSMVDIPTSLSAVGERTFYGCDHLTGVAIQSKTVTLGVEAFANCPNLTLIRLDTSLIQNDTFNVATETNTTIVSNDDNVKNMAWDETNRTVSYQSTKPTITTTPVTTDSVDYGSTIDGIPLSGTASVSGWFEWKNPSAVPDVINKGYDVVFQPQLSNFYDSVDCGKVVVTVIKSYHDNIPTVTGCSVSANGVSDGAIIGVDDSLEYTTFDCETEEMGEWISVGEGKTAITDLVEGIYLVRFAECENQYASDYREVVIGKEKPPIVTPPPATPTPTVEPTPVPVKTPSPVPTTIIKKRKPTIVKIKAPGKPKYSVTRGKKKFTVKIKKVSGAKGYQIWICSNKKFKSVKKIVTSKTKVVVKEKKRKTVYLKIRAYKTYQMSKKYGKFSKVLKIKVK